MQEKSWKDIWNKRKLHDFDMKVLGGGNEFKVFCALKKLDGFDVNVGDEKKYFEGFYSDWNRMSATISNLNISFASVYEVGCGCGVNLYMFKNRIPDLIVGGIDYSDNLIGYARQIVLDGFFSCGEAAEIDEDDKYDIVMADSVFQYFPSVSYAESVLHKMCNKALQLVFLGEIHDKNLEKEWLNNRRKAIKNYNELYEGLGRTFVTREWVEEIAAAHSRKVVFEKKDNVEYWSSAYVFNAYIY